MNAKNGKIRAGIIGIGNWGRYGHVPVLQLLPNFEIVAVAENYGVPFAEESTNGLRFS